MKTNIRIYWPNENVFLNTQIPKRPIKVKFPKVPREPALQPRGAENIKKNRSEPWKLAK